jgi:NAD(P)-dependent dehydrogenase (short-subunit alcohol dehydrogenase family)
MVAGEPAGALARRLDGRVALVTGATHGVGFELVRRLARGGATVLAGCRSLERFRRLQDVLSDEDGVVTAECLEPAFADLESQTAVEALAADLLRRRLRLDLLFLNAGIHDVPHALTAEGHERTLATNYLGHFRLLHRLASGGALAPDARIVVTQSEAVTGNPLARADLAALVAPRATAARRLVWRAIASPNSKVLLALAALEYGRRVAGTSLAATRFVAGSPGPLRTGNVDQPGLAMALLKQVAPLLLRPAGEGADLLLWVATAPEAGEASGLVFGRDRRPRRLRRAVRDPDLARRAWDLTERALALPPFAPAGASTNSSG